MKSLYAAWMRHGDYHQLPDTPSAHQPFPLNDIGERQAGEGAALLADFMHRRRVGLDTEIDSSRLLRSWQTARIVSDALSNDTSSPHIRAFDELAERGLGSAANLTLSQIEQAVEADPRFAPLPADWKSNSHFCLPLQGAESLMQAGERVAAHVQYRMEQLWEAENDHVLKVFVGHGAAFRHAACCLGLMSFDDIARHSMYHARPLFFQVFQEEEQLRWQPVEGQWKVRGERSAYTD